MKIITLNHVLKQRQNVMLKILKEGERPKYKGFSLAPNKTYKLDFEIDEDALLRQTVSLKYTKEKEEYLKEENADYKVEVCRSCGGRKKTLKVTKAEILSVDDEKWEEV